jgi:hypothetical protein
MSAPASTGGVSDRQEARRADPRRDRLNIGARFVHDRLQLAGWQVLTASLVSKLTHLHRCLTAVPRGEGSVAAAEPSPRGQR